MNGDPYRGQQSSDRRVINRAGAASSSAAGYRQPEEPQPVREEPKAPAHSTSRRPEPKRLSSKRLIAIISVALVIIIAGIIGWLVWSKSQTSTSTGIDNSKYQAVFFTNGQVYFGKLHEFNTQYLKLTDIYYLQGQSNSESDKNNPQQTNSNTAGNVQLIKLGDEIHGPEDEMILSKDQVLFYENLKADGKVAQSIDKYKSSK